MKNSFIPKNVRQKIIDIFDKYLDDDYVLFLFGSFAEGNFDRTSDIDLAIYSDKEIGDAIIAQIKDELETKVPTLRNFDLINLTSKNLDQKILENIINKGIIWKKTKNIKELLNNLKNRLKNFKK